jgi:hypothetical protein
MNKLKELLKDLKRVVLNFTQHEPTADQLEQFDICSTDHDVVKELLTFQEIPDQDEMDDRATKLARIALDEGISYAMIGGAPYFMTHLEYRMYSHAHYFPVYAFSKREVTETTDDDGNTVKNMVFKHEGFVNDIYNNSDLRMPLMMDLVIKEMMLESLMFQDAMHIVYVLEYLQNMGFAQAFGDWAANYASDYEDDIRPWMSEMLTHSDKYTNTLASFEQMQYEWTNFCVCYYNCNGRIDWIKELISDHTKNSWQY